MQINSEEQFRNFVISYSIMEAMSTTSPEDRLETITDIKSTLSSRPTRDLAILAHEAGIIDYTDDIYKTYLRK